MNTRLLRAGARRIAWLALLAASPAATAAQNAQLDTVAESTGAATALATEDSEARERTATSIQALLDGSLPDDFVVQTLFQVDLLDEAAVERRRDELRQAIALREGELASADSSRAQEINALVRVDRLRLQFLSRPAVERERVNRAEKRRRELAREQEAAARNRQDAEARAQEAESQRQRALAEARIRQSAVLEDLAQEMARAQTVLAGLARVEAELAQARESKAKHAQNVMNEVWDLGARLQAPTDDADINGIFDVAVERQQRSFQLLRQALAAHAAPSVVPDATPDQALIQLRDSTVAERVAAIRDSYAEIASAAVRIRAIEREVRWQAFEYEAEHTRILNALRIHALERLPAERRNRVLGINRAAMLQFRIESTHVALSARAYVVSRLHNLDRVPTALRDIFKLGTAFYVVLRVALVVWFAVLLRRHWKGIVSWLQQTMLRNVRSFGGARRVRSLIGMLRVAAPWTFLLLVLWVLGGALGAAADWPEVALALRIAMWYAAYRLTVNVLHASIVRIARHYFPDLGTVTTMALLRSMRRILGVVFGIAIALDVSERLLGPGYLYHVIAQLAGLAVLATVLGVLHGWREEISETYLRVAPAGRLANAVQSTRQLWFGFFVGIVAFAWLAGRVLWIIGRDFVLGFEQVRRALAFMFRRRMEKRAEQHGYSAGDIEALPAPLVESFSDGPVLEERLVVDHFPGLDDFEGALERWRATGSGGQFLLVGERGMGKTSWLARVQGANGLRVDRCELNERIWTKSALIHELQSRLLPEANFEPRLKTLQLALLEGEPRLVALDMCQNLFLGKVGGYEGLEAFSELMNGTSSNVFWLCACNSHAWDHLEAVRPDLALFQYRKALARWSEDGIRQLIETRVAASGVEVDFQELVLDRFDPVTTENRLVGAEEAYIRLLWDFSDGNPRAAIHYWLRSLETESAQRVRVRLFRSPSSELLEATNEVAQFILAAVIVHENLTVSEAAATTRYPQKLCRMHLNRFVENDVLNLESGRYRVSTHWHRTVLRFLRRKNLLAD